MVCAGRDDAEVAAPGRGDRPRGRRAARQLTAGRARPRRSSTSSDPFAEAGVQRVYLQVLDHVRSGPRRVLRQPRSSRNWADRGRSIARGYYRARERTTDDSTSDRTPPWHERTSDRRRGQRRRAARGDRRCCGCAISCVVARFRRAGAGAAVLPGPQRSRDRESPRPRRRRPSTETITSTSPAGHHRHQPRRHDDQRHRHLDARTTTTSFDPSNLPQDQDVDDLRRRPSRGRGSTRPARCYPPVRQPLATLSDPARRSRRPSPRRCAPRRGRPGW